MANSKSAEKRARQNTKKYELKHAQRSMVRTAVKSVVKAIESSDKESGEVFKNAQSRDTHRAAAHGISRKMVSEAKLSKIDM